MSRSTSSNVTGFDTGDCSRVTVVGYMLRRTKFDELPQLLNVIAGQMSLVGPRPEIERWTLIYPEKWDVVLRARPGITDWGSIAYCNEENILAAADEPESVYQRDILPEKLEHYIEYVSNIRFTTDVRILWHTLLSIVGSKE